LVLPLSWGLMVALGAGRSERATAVAMTCPLFVAAVFLSLEGKAAWSAVGWRPPPPAYASLSVGLPILQLGLVLLLDSAGGWAKFDSSHLITRFPTTHLGLNLFLGIPGIVVPFLLLSPGTLLAGWVSHLGEEVAWRGYLFGALVRRGNALPSVALVAGTV
jgi:membrane protease YdiL (CAAX protease family)